MHETDAIETGPVAPLAAGGVLTNIDTGEDMARTSKAEAKPKRKPAGGGGPRNWRPDDYRAVMREALPLVLHGSALVDALAAAQHVLPPSKHQHGRRLVRKMFSDHLRAALNELLPTLTEDERYTVTHAHKTSPGNYANGKRVPHTEPTPPVALTPVAEAVGHSPEPAPSSAAKRITRTPVRWALIELALLARRIQHWKTNLQDKRGLARLYIEAQKIELPPERHRTTGSIGVSSAPSARQRQDGNWRHSLPELLERGLANQDLIAGIPFEHNRKRFVAHPDYNPSVCAAAYHDPHKRPVAPQTQGAPASPLTEPARAPQRPAFEFVDPTPLDKMADEMGAKIAGAIRDYGASMVAAMLEQMREQLIAAGQDMLTKAVATIRAGSRQMVHEVLRDELGGPVGKPEAQGLVTVVSDDAGAHEALALDVVGLIGPQVTEVRQALNGYADAVRFIDADHVGNWTPRPVVLLNTKFISHDAEGKCRKAGVKPIRVHGGAGAVVNAVRELYAREGIPLATAH